MDFGPPPPKKKFTNFSIEEILREDFPQHKSHILDTIPTRSSSHPSHPQIGSGIATTTHSIDHYLERMGSLGVYNTKFKLIKNRSKFVIKNVPEDPEDLLSKLFQQCIDDAINEAKEKKLEPDQLGASISSDLLDPDIWIPVRDITDNTVESIMNRFLIVAQSKTHEGSLWGEPFTVTVMVCSKKNLSSNQIVGSGAIKKLSPVTHQIDKNSLLHVMNTDSYCLFYALQLTYVHATKLLPDWKFHRYFHRLHGQKGQLIEDTLELMQKLNIPRGQESYDAAIYGQRIIDYWNAFHKNKFVFKLFIFDQAGHYKPSFKYGPENFTTPLVLYHHEKHFDGVKSIASFFERKNYCLSCESPFNDKRRHKKSCRNRCLNCGQYQVGSHPCPESSNFKKYCPSCKKTFVNENCYKYHLEKGACLKSKRCEACGKIYDIKDNARNGRISHTCNERFCFVCKSFHDKTRGCFIEPLKPKDYKPTRFIIFDFETIQNRDVDPNLLPGRKWHLVNFVAVKVICDECILNKRWRDSLLNKPCAICGHHRTVTFSHRCFFSTKVDMQVVVKNPLKTFTEWILYYLPKEYTTIAFKITMLASVFMVHNSIWVH